MAKGKWERWLKKESLILLKGWAQDGLTDEEIAKNMGIAVSTLYDWKNKFSEISEAIKKGKEVVDYQVQSALLQKALAGDVTAQIFWLSNRQPEKWKRNPQSIDLKREEFEHKKKMDEINNW